VQTDLSYCVLKTLIIFEHLPACFGISGTLWDTGFPVKLTSCFFANLFIYLFIFRTFMFELLTNRHRWAVNHVQDRIVLTGVRDLPSLQEEAPSFYAVKLGFW
jgi:hypothetical protein